MLLDRMYIRESFEGEDLSGSELSGIFINVDFTGANLTGARLNGKFICSAFDGANLTDADLRDGLFVASSLDLAIQRPRGSSHQQQHSSVQQSVQSERNR